MLRYLIFFIVFSFVYNLSIFSNSDVTNTEIQNALQQSAIENQIPVFLLETLAWQNSRWTPYPEYRYSKDFYGMFALSSKKTSYRNIEEAASLLGVSVTQLKTNYKMNISAAAKILKKLILEEIPNYEQQIQGLSISQKIKLFENAILKFMDVVSLQQKTLYIDEINLFLQHGFTIKDNPDIIIQGLNIANLLASPQISDDGLPIGKYDPPKAGQPCNSYVDGWDASPNYSDRGVPMTSVKRIVIHTTEGSFYSAVSVFNDPSYGASSHYVIRSSDGYVLQMVDIEKKAWHARNANPDTIGIEHEALVAQPAYYTDIMHQKSAALVKCLCELYNIPKDRVSIIGHVSLPLTNTHYDPGIYWKWDYYMQLITGIDPRYNARFVSATYPAVMNSGDIELAIIRLLNTGTSPWYQSSIRIVSSNSYPRLSDFYDSSNWESSSVASFSDNQIIQPGEIGEFTFQLKAPSVSSQTDYYEKFALGYQDTQINLITVERDGSKTEDAIPLDITVYPSAAPSGNPITISTTSPLPDAEILKNYFTTIEATGGNNGLSYSFASTSAHPSWLQISESGGYLYGLPQNKTGSPYSVVIKVSDKIETTNFTEQTLLLTTTGDIDNSTPLVIDNSINISATQREALTYTLSASGGTSSYHWDKGGLGHDSSQLVWPAWLSISEDGILSGLPNESQSTVYQPIIIEVTDSSVPPQVVTKSFVITVTASNSTDEINYSLPTGCNCSNSTLSTQAKLDSTIQTGFPLLMIVMFSFIRRRK